MLEGRLLKEKKEYLVTRFTTKQGLVDMLVGGFVFGYLVVNFTPRIYAKIQGIVSVNGVLKNYISYLIFGFIMSVVGYYLSVLIISIYNMLFKR